MRVPWKFCEPMGAMLMPRARMGGCPPRGPGSTCEFVDCASGEPIGPDAAADVQPNVNPNGRLQLLWRTNGSWAGSCRSLVVRLGFAGWTGADASFTIRFA